MSGKRKTLKRPCSFCRRWFQPDRRVRGRQKACDDPKCRAERKRRSQAEWSARNPDYWTGRRLAAKAHRLESRELPARDLLDEAPACRRVPADIAQDAFNAQALVLIAFLVKVLDRRAQDALRAQVPVVAVDLEKVLPSDTQDATAKRGPSP